MKKVESKKKPGKPAKVQKRIPKLKFPKLKKKVVEFEKLERHQQIKVQALKYANDMRGKNGYILRKFTTIYDQTAKKPLYQVDFSYRYAKILKERVIVTLDIDTLNLYGIG